ncbi:MAG TPA: MaoC family dehydratase N-terminal domain-containing protein [Casimicrobiaceae bacterium]|nr:MaoC family dehydratase N-terminal domain-containing protein [Casimicrobiaceae bacterium]
MIDMSHIGKAIEPHVADVEAGRLRLFAKAIGETRPEYVDEAAARAAGHPALPAPPTFALCLDLEMPDPFKWITDMGVDIARVLHGGELFRYFHPIYAGDRVTVRSRVADILQKKSSRKAFVVKETEVTNQHGVKVAEMRATIVVVDP